MDPCCHKKLAPGLSQYGIFLKLRIVYIDKARQQKHQQQLQTGNTKGGSIIVPLTSCLTGLDWFVLQIKTKIVSCHTDDSRPVKQEVNGTVILLPLVFPGYRLCTCLGLLERSSTIRTDPTCVTLRKVANSRIARCNRSKLCHCLDGIKATSIYFYVYVFCICGRFKTVQMWQGILTEGEGSVQLTSLY